MISLPHRTCALALLGLATLGAAEPVLVADTASGSLSARVAGQLTLIDELTALPLPPGPPSGQLAFHGGFLGQLDLDGSGVPAKPLALSIRLPSGSLVAGGTAILVAVGGSPPLRITASGSQVLTTQVAGTADLDGDSEPDTGALGLLTPGAAGPLTALVTDALGATVSLSLTATSLTAVSVPAPTVAISTGTDTVYGAFCPSTARGVQSVLTWAAGRDVRSGRAFAWDAQAQWFTALPTQPAGGLAPDQGVFLAAREPVRLDLSGNPGPLAHAWLLLPGWNLIGIPALVDDDGVPVATHDRAADFVLQDETGAAITDSALAATLASPAYAWDGSTYQTTATLRSGQAYWIANNTDSPGRPLFLVRNEGGALDAPRPRSAIASGYRTRDRGTPPAPPSATSAQAEDGGGCGAGGGIALVGTLLIGLAFRRRR